MKAHSETHCAKQAPRLVAKHVLTPGFPSRSKIT